MRKFGKVGEERKEASASERSSWTFARLLREHFRRGTRPGEDPTREAGVRMWTHDELSKRLRCSQRTIRNWLGENTDATVPNESDYQAVEALLFGDDHGPEVSRWRAELRDKHQQARWQRGRAIRDISDGSAPKSEMVADNPINPENMSLAAKSGTESSVAQSVNFDGLQVKMKLDERGRTIEKAWFDADGHPAFNSDQLAKITWKIDNDNRITEEAYFGIDGKPTLSANQIARINWNISDHGRVIEETYFGVDGLPAANVHQISRVYKIMDKHGQSAEESYFGINGEPVLNFERAARITWKRNDRGRVIECAYFDADGQPTLNRSDVARIAWKIDDTNRVTEESYFGIDGQPILGPCGSVRVVWKYRADGSILEVNNFGSGDY
jgi:hypothetical protein